MVLAGIRRPPCNERFLHSSTAGVDNLLDKTYGNHLSPSHRNYLNEPALNAYLTHKVMF